MLIFAANLDQELSNFIKNLLFLSLRAEKFTLVFLISLCHSQTIVWVLLQLVLHDLHNLGRVQIQEQ